MKTYLICPDIHIPYHDETFIKLIIKIIKEINPDGFVSLGDFLDCFQISSYDKDPARKNFLVEDIDLANKIFTDISRHLKSGASIHLICGNHENRLFKWVAKHAKELHGLVPDWPELMQIKLRNKTTDKKWYWHSYNKWDSCKIGDCVLLHGFYFNQHATATNLAKYRCSTISGHTHRAGIIYDGHHYAVSLGHGSNEKLTAHQPTPTGWSQALALLHVDSHGKTFVDLLRVHNGRTVINGKAISV